MTLDELQLINFRSHRERSLDLGPVTVLLGPNGVGKTNVLEAIWYLATTRSFRTNRDHEVIRWDATGAKITSGRYEIRLAKEPFQKALTIDGVRHRAIDYLGELRAVLFTPDSLAIVTGGPSERRQFLDILLSQRDRALARVLGRYRMVVKERNALLRLIARGQAQQTELEPWDEKLMDWGMQIIHARQALAAELFEPVNKHYQELAGAEDQVELEYVTSTASRDEFTHQLQRLAEREIAGHITLVGPHRDDLVIRLRGTPAANYASRGEIRSILLAIKWSECDAIRTATDMPLLLLDDVFSELDRSHREALAEIARAAQTICSTTDVESLPSIFTKDANLITLEASV